MILELDGGVVAAQTDATLNIPTDLREIITKNQSNFVSHLSGKQEWSISQDVFYTDGSDEVFIPNERVALSVDDGSGMAEVARLTDITLNLSQNLAEVSSLDRPLWRYLRPAERLWTIEATGNWVDPKGNTLESILDAKDAREYVDVELDVDGTLLTGSVAVGNISVSGATGGESTSFDLTLGGNGVLTKAGTMGNTDVEALYDLYFSQTLVPTTLRFEEGDIWYVGSSYAGEVNISIVEGEEIVASLSLEGDGPIARDDQTAT